LKVPKRIVDLALGELSDDLTLACANYTTIIHGNLSCSLQARWFSADIVSFVVYLNDIFQEKLDPILQVFDRQRFETIHALQS